MADPGPNTRCPRGRRRPPAPVLTELRQRAADLALVGGTVDGMESEAADATTVLPVRGADPDASRGLQKVTETW
jgi:hypothetical protein